MIKWIRSCFQWLFHKPVLWLSEQYSSAPQQADVFAALSHLYDSIIHNENAKGQVKEIDPHQDRIIILSDMHKGTGDGSDDFEDAAVNYLRALHYYEEQGYHLVILGDSEELWENNLLGVMLHHAASFEAEKKFVVRNAFTKIYGNHDLFWDNDPFAPIYLKKIYGQALPIHAGLVLRVRNSTSAIDILCTHGHQGDRQSDGNAFSKWFVSYIWGPIQSFLDVNINRPSNNDVEKTKHNRMMYAWSARQEGIWLITGHTHQPVFQSLTHLERLYLQLEEATRKKDESAIQTILTEIPRRQRQYRFVNEAFHTMKPTYFNTGCCCFANGSITGIEIADGQIRLIKWNQDEGRVLLEQENILSTDDNIQAQ